jgi:hypothetical protein
MTQATNPAGGPPHSQLPGSSSLIDVSPPASHERASMKDDITRSREAATGRTTQEEAMDRIGPLWNAYVCNAHESDPYETVLGDLLADLQHWADYHHLDWDAALRIGEFHHACESDEDLPEDDGAADERTSHV